MEVDVAKISLKGTSVNDMLPLLSPPEHIRQRVKTVIDLIQNLLEVDSNCSGGAGHVINVSLYEEDVIEQVITSIEDRWEITREGDCNKRLRIRPLLIRGLCELQMLITKQRLRWNFDDGPLFIDVAPFRSDAVIKTLALLREKGWEARLVEEEIGRGTECEHSKPVQLSIEMNKVDEG